MLETPFDFEAKITPEEYHKLGRFVMRCALIEQIIGNCLKVMLRLTDEQALLVVFDWTFSKKIDMLRDVGATVKLNARGRAALDEFLAVIRAIQFVRNNAVHGVFYEDPAGKRVLRRRPKDIEQALEEVFETEELSIYAAHAIYSLRFALGFKKGAIRARFALPQRPAVPGFLRTRVQWPQTPSKAAAKRQPPPSRQ